MNYNNGPYFIALWRHKFPVRIAARIQREIKGIDSKASFVNTTIPGTGNQCWLERPNDGTNDYIFRRDTNNRMRGIVQRYLEEAEAGSSKRGNV